MKKTIRSICSWRAVLSGAFLFVFPGLPLSAAQVDLAKEGFSASGWMGDGAQGQKYVKFDQVCKESPHSPPTCQKWTYIKGGEGWAAVAWQYPPNNWGDKAGKKLPAGTIRVTWFARGANGGEEVEFFTGGNTAPDKAHQSSLDKESMNVTLTREWKQYSLELKGDLSQVMCGFGWSLQGADAPITFYLDDISYDSGEKASTDAPAKASADSPGKAAMQPGKPAESARGAAIAELGFAASGWMGDGEQGQKYVKLDEVCNENPHSAPTCQKWTYTKGGTGWAAVAWQFPSSNWGDKPGKALASSGFTKLTFFVRGANGGEEVEFFSGGNSAPQKAYQASYQKVSKTVTLTREWQEVSIPLAAKDMSSVISAFGWSANQSVTFFVDDIRFE